MSGETTRRAFLQGGTLATMGAAAQAQEPPAPHPPEHEHHEHAAPGDYPRDRPGTGGAVGSPTDRGMLVPGRRPAGEPPPRVIVPDLPEKLAWTMVDGV
jgi:hypothetical protein